MNNPYENIDWLIEYLPAPKKTDSGKLKSEEIVRRVYAGYITVFNECSRWEIYSLKRTLIGAPEPIKRKVVAIIDDCMGSF